MRSGIRLGRVAGAPVVADASAFVLALIFGVVVLVDLRASEGLDTSVDWLIATVGGLGALITVFLHEAAHAVMAKVRGLNVRAIRP